MTKTAGALRWFERLLFLLGGLLTLWCVMVVTRAEYYARMPVPEASPASTPSAEATTLPGEASNRPGNHNPRASKAQPGAWLARLDAPSIRLKATVLEGTDTATLARGAGHIEGTPMPGDPGNVGIAGHRDTVFRPLRRINIGDELTMTTAARVFHYRVLNAWVVNPEDVFVLDPTASPVLTLVTCYPFEFIGNAPRRFVVRAELVRQEARSTEGANADLGKRPGPIRR